MSLFQRRSSREYRRGLHSRLYKVIVIGEVNTGKSALIRRYVHNFFTENYRSTVGVDFHLKILPYNDNLEVRLQLWDIAGQERFSKMTRAYFKGAVGAFIVFDISNPNSYDAIKKWKKELDDKCLLPEGKRLPAILIANKCDLERHSQIPEDVDISSFAVSQGFASTWFKTSAKTGHHVNDPMNLMVKYIMAMDTWSIPYSHIEPEECQRQLLPVTPEVREIQSNSVTRIRKLSFDIRDVLGDEDDDEEEPYKNRRCPDRSQIEYRRKALRNYIEKANARNSESIQVTEVQSVVAVAKKPKTIFKCSC